MKYLVHQCTMYIKIPNLLCSMTLWIDLEPGHPTFNNVGAQRLDFTDVLFPLSPQQPGGTETSNISQILYTA